MGRVVYASDVPLVLLDENWIPAKDPVTTYTINPIGGIDIDHGFADPYQTTLEVMTIAEKNPDLLCSHRRKSS